MKIATGNIPAVIAEYFDSVIMPSAQMAGGVKAFTVGFIGGLVSRQAPQMVDQYTPMARALGLVNNENMLDIDMAYEEASKALSKTPLVVAGYRADQEDLNRIRDIARKYAV